MTNLELVAKVCEPLGLFVGQHPDDPAGVCLGSYEILPQEIMIPSVRGDVRVSGWVVNVIEMWNTPEGFEGFEDCDVVCVGECRDFRSALSVAFSGESKRYCERVCEAVGIEEQIAWDSAMKPEV